VGAKDAPQKMQCFFAIKRLANLKGGFKENDVRGGGLSTKTCCHMP